MTESARGRGRAVVDGQVLLVQDSPMPPEPDAVPVLVRIAQVTRQLVGLAGLARRQMSGPLAPLSGPLILATAPLARVVGAGADATRPAVALRAGGRDVTPNRRGLAAAYPTAGGRLLVLVSAPGEGEEVWSRGSEQTGVSYGDRLASLLGWTPLTLRVERGLSVAEAGVALGSLLQCCVDEWPVPVERVVLVAHGTGGLVARAALALRTAPAGECWVDRTTELVALGTPRLTSASKPLTRGGRVLDQQLAGIVAAEPGLLDVPAVPTVSYVVVSDRAQLRGDPVGGVLGGLLWWRHRGPGRARDVRDLFPTAEHFEVSLADAPLVNHPDVHHALMSWLA